MSTMIRAYLRTLRPLLQPSGEAVGLRNALCLETQPLRRVFASVPPRAGPTRLPILPKTGSRGISSRLRPTTNPTTTTITARKSLRSPLPTTRHKRSFHKTSRLRNSKTDPGPANGAAQQEPQGLSARLKKLSREYGWAAVGVYLSLSVLDFPLCFLLVRIVGTDKIGQIEEWVVSHATKAIPESVRIRWREYRAALKEARQEQLGDNVEETVEVAGWGVEEAEQANKAGASLGTQLALAYAIHKSFIFLRVPLTAAVTPKVVKVLRSWGWNIGKRRTKGRARRT